MGEGDFDAVAAVSLAQDLAWWGESHGNADDVRSDVDRAVAAMGSLDSGTRVAVVSGVGGAGRTDGETDGETDSAIVGVALHLGHGQSSLFADQAHPLAADARAELIDWLMDTGATIIDAPAQDLSFLAMLAARGLVPTRSSFELERDADLADLARVPPPDGIELVDFRLGVDDQDVHDAVYSVWTDVPGHTYRPIEEWREIFLGGPRSDPGLVVLARRTDDDRRVAGVAIGTMFDDVGWVMQIAVGRPDRSVGLGRALLVEALHRLVAAGAQRVGLSVEAANDTALGLYRSVGLEITGEWRHHTLPSLP